MNVYVITNTIHFLNKWKNILIIFLHQELKVDKVQLQKKKSLNIYKCV